MGTTDVSRIWYRRPHDRYYGTPIAGNSKREVARHDRGSGKYRKGNFRNEGCVEKHLT